MANRNTESHFSQIPRANIRRARFKRNYSNTTTINEGEIIPIYVDEVLPGDTVNLTQNSLVRMATPIYPVMDNCYLDIYYFFCPNRLLWEHWENLMGQNDDSYWAPKTEYSVPQTTAPSGGWKVGTIADYMGIPTGVSNISVNSLPFRAYARIWNEWFRDENLQQPVVQDTDDSNEVGSNTGEGLINAQRGGLPLKAGKMHDYFTSCLPEPQKGEASAVPIDIALNAEVITTPRNHDVGGSPLNWKAISGQASSTNKGYNIAAWFETSRDTAMTQTGQSYSQGASDILIAPSNLELRESNTASSISINELRQAIAIQHILEADARGGTRYTELLKNEFGVTSPDSRLQRSEYIGGTRIPININQVIQQSATDTTSPQGNTAAYSLTTSRNKMMTYSATEHGYILGLAVIRVDHSYQQGLRRMWSRTRRFDFYHPMLANLGEMEVLNKEIYCQGNEDDDDVFGYQEAWADYRYHPNMVTGEMRSKYEQSLDAWHYADYYKELPVLSSEWIQEGKENIDRTIAVQSEISHQFIANFYFEQTWTRPMPIYSVPGLEKI